MKLFVSDREILKATIDKATGFLTAPVTLSRIGVQYYSGEELGIKDRLKEKFGVFRSPEEVFHPDSLGSYKNLTVTDNHPAGFVTVNNVKKLQVGQVSEVEKTGDTSSGVITITDSDVITKIGKGKIEVSVGYSNNLVEKKGVFDGLEYEYLQTDIRANHLAIVDAGRCGSDCKITMDKGKGTKMKITIDGIEYDAGNEQLLQAIQKMQKSHDAEVEEMKKKADEEEKEKEKLKKDKEKAEAEKDTLKKDALDADAIDKLVGERAELLATAKNILGDKMPECTDCPKEIKTAVVDEVLNMGDLSGKSMEYVDAVYDIAISRVEKTKGSLDKLNDDFQKDNRAVRETARDKYMKDHLGIGE